MRSELLAALACVAALCAGCPASPFRCARAADCNAGSVCTSDNACAEPAAACPSGYRYSSSASRAGACVPTADAATDATDATVDAPIDATIDATIDAALDAAPDIAIDATIPDATLVDATNDASSDATTDGTSPVDVRDAADVSDAPDARDAADTCAAVVRQIAPLSTSRVSAASARLRVRIPDGFTGSVEITLADSADLTQNPRTLTLPAGTTEIVPTGLTPGMHFWQAHASCTSGVEGPSSPIWSFQTRGALAPLAGEGNVVGWALDVNGDGLGDIVAGAPRTEASLARPRVVVIQGAPLGVAGPRYIFGSVATDPDTLGQQVVVVPDMNGDGLSEIAASACARATGSAACNDLVVVYAGSRDGSFPELARLTPGVLAGTRFGRAIAGVGDIDGDGYGDLAIGAPNANYLGIGRLYVVFGGRSGLTLSAPIERPSSEIAPALTLYGHGVAGVGDVTGDGLADVLVTAFQRAWILAGGAAWRRVTPAPDEIAVPESSAVEGAYGYSASAAGDFNHDGAADFAVARPGLDVVSIYRGVSPTGASIAGITSIVHPRFADAGVADLFGYTIASGGDLTGDGADDLLVAAPNERGEGAVYELPGGAARLSEVPIPSVPGGVAPFGQSLSILGDFNGNGSCDAVISTGHTGAMPGAVHLFLGNGGRLPGITFNVTLTQPPSNSFGTSLARR